MEEELNRKGWHLTPEGQQDCTEDGDKSTSADSIIKKALNLDLRAIGKKWLPTDISSGRIKADYVEGPAVLQVLKLRNVSAPKDNEESQAAPRLWKITLTDGHANVAAICLQPLKNLSLVTPPGTKLLLEGKVDVMNGYLLLSNKNSRMLGGHVPNLEESWQLKRKLAQQSRVGIQTEGGPPPFVPFGKKMSRSKVEAPQRDDFKSLAAGSQVGEEENSEFQQQRQATIAEAESLTAKTFGGGLKSSVKDSDVARIIEMGFTVDQAGTALRQSGGNVNEAIGKLVGGHFDGRGQDYGQGRTRGGGGRGGAFRDRGDRGEQREEGERGARRGGRRERGRRDRGEEEEEDSLSSRPSGPSTLFDFLETKIPAKSEKQSFNKQRPYSGQGPKSSADQQTDQRPRTALGDGSSSQRPCSTHQSRGEDWGNPPYERREAKTPQGVANQDTYRDIRSSGREHKNAQNASQRQPQCARVSSNPDRDSRSSGREQTDVQNASQRQPQSAHVSSNNNRGKNSREERTSQRDENQQKQPHQVFQQADPSDRHNRPKSQQSFQADRSDRQKKYQNSDSRQNGGDFHQRPARSDQNHSRPFGEQKSNMVGHASGSHVNRHHPQAGTNRANCQAAGQRAQADSRQKGPSQPRWRRGQVVLAKYWEDNQLYRAVVEVVAENGYTAVVTFLDYGNQEEVLCADIHPMQPQAYQNNSGPAVHPQGHFPDSRHVSMPVSYPPASDAGFDSNSIPKMEFRRGGSGQGHRWQEQENRRRPTQNYYTPPNQKK